MKTRNIVMLVGLGVLSVVSLVIVIVSVATHTEAGLLTACEHPSTRLNYGEGCFDVTWERDQFPLQVHATTTNPSPPSDPEDATQSVISLLNNRLGFTALQWTDDPAAADIAVTIGVAQEVGLWMDHANGATSHLRAADGTLSCEVSTWNTGTAELLDKVLTHEMGHALGLAHDDFPDSAMYYTVTPDGARLTRGRLTDYDRNLLRELYAPWECHGQSNC